MLNVHAEVVEEMNRLADEQLQLLEADEHEKVKTLFKILNFAHLNCYCFAIFCPRMSIQRGRP